VTSFGVVEVDPVLNAPPEGLTVLELIEVDAFILGLYPKVVFEVRERGGVSW